MVRQPDLHQDGRQAEEETVDAGGKKNPTVTANLRGKWTTPRVWLLGKEVTDGKLNTDTLEIGPTIGS